MWVSRLATAPRRWTASLYRLVKNWARRPTWQTSVPSKDPTAFVRARPEFILVEEELTYDQVISRNESSTLRNPPSGRICVSVPYDGGTCFGADAYDDAKIHLASAATKDAVLGHIVFVEHEETDLEEVLGLKGTFGRYPLQIPIRSAKLRDPTMLTADRFTYRTDIAYRPSSEGPKVQPLAVSVDLFDPGHQDGSFLRQSTIKRVAYDKRLQQVMARITTSAVS